LSLKQIYIFEMSVKLRILYTGRFWSSLEGEKVVRYSMTFFTILGPKIVEVYETGSDGLKGQCHEIFDPRFFSSNNPP
jgi:hypothetical protein